MKNETILAVVHLSGRMLTWHSKGLIPNKGKNVNVKESYTTRFW